MGLNEHVPNCWLQPLLIHCIAMCLYMSVWVVYNLTTRNKHNIMSKQSLFYIISFGCCIYGVIVLNNVSLWMKTEEKREHYQLQTQELNRIKYMEQNLDQLQEISKGNQLGISTESSDDETCTVHRTLKDLLPSSSMSKYFVRTLTDEHETMMRHLLTVLTTVFNANNITYFMSAGTLLGSYLHHGIIPWDDDIDILSPRSQKAKAKKVLDKLSPKYGFTTPNRFSKFFASNAKPLKPHKGEYYPFLDLLFYPDKNTTHIQELSHIHSKAIIFPVVQRPFWNMSLPAPRDTLQYLRNRYVLSDCPTNHRNHSTRSNINKVHWKHTPCQNLYRDNPFVFRCTSPSGRIVNETLWIGDRMLSWVAFSNGRIVKQSPNQFRELKQNNSV